MLLDHIASSLHFPSRSIAAVSLFQLNESAFIDVSKIFVFRRSWAV